MIACAHDYRPITRRGIPVTRGRNQGYRCSKCGDTAKGIAPPRDRRLAAEVKAWRASRGLSTSAAAEALGLPVRTLEGIEQDRPFRYEKLLRLALKSS